MTSSPQNYESLSKSPFIYSLTKITKARTFIR
jgi:hypothetical protein